MTDHPAKVLLDISAGGTAIATLAGWLPAVSALFTIIWLGIRIFESKTVQRLLGNKDP